MYAYTHTHSMVGDIHVNVYRYTQHDVYICTCRCIHKYLHVFFFHWSLASVELDRTNGFNAETSVVQGIVE